MITLSSTLSTSLMPPPICGMYVFFGVVVYLVVPGLHNASADTYQKYSCAHHRASTIPLLHPPQATKNMSSTLAETYKALLTALVPICDDCLFFVEGTDQWRWQVMASWGDGFASNPVLVNYSKVGEWEGGGEGCCELHIISSMNL